MKTSGTRSGGRSDGEAARTWVKLWANFEDELSISLKRDRVTAMLSTTPARSVVYAVVFGAIGMSLFAVCN